MNSMAKQMDMFEEGGLMDEGGTVDPVSGNDVPPGSTQEEVRDDIPAQLSEGEFVFPADVVRYFGLEKLMEMRQEAKAGLARMEAMGQMGNSEEATLPDDIPFSIEDLDMEDEGEYNTPQEFAYGGVVQMPGTNYTTTPNPGPTTGFRPYVAPSIPGYTPQPIQTGPQYQGIQLPGTKFTGATEKTNIPTFTQTIGTNPGQYDEFRTYVNSSGQTLQIPFKNGQPLYPIPQGYTLQKEDAVTTESTVPTTTVGQDEGGDGDGVSSESTTTSTVTGYTSPTSTMSDVGGFLTKDVKANANAFGGSKAFGTSNKALRNATIDQAIYQTASTGTGGILSNLAMEFGFTKADANSMAVAGQQAKEATLTTLGFTRASQLQTSIQATMLGNAISAAHAAAKKGEDVTVALAKELDNPAYTEAIQGAAVSAIQQLGYTSDKISDPAVVSRAVAGYRAVADAYREDAAQTKSSGTVRDSKGNPVTSKSGVVMSEQARNQMNAELEAAKTAEAKANAIAAARARSIGNVARDDAVYGEPTEDDINNAKAAAEAATNFDDYGDEFGNLSDSDMSSSQSAASAGYAEDTPGGGEFGGGMNEAQGDSNGGNDDPGGDPSGMGGATGASDSFAKGGLAKQMKRSGLASKK